MKTVFMSVIFILCAFLVGGCATGATSGKKFDVSKAAEIKKGVTTKTDILAMFGEPNTKSQSPYGESWSYSYTETKGLDIFGTLKYAYGIEKAKMDMSSQSLSITFKGDIVGNYSTNESKM